MLRGLFVTGTDTNIGKTVVSAALIHRYRSAAELRYWKPVQTGIEQDDDTAAVQHLGCRRDETFPPGIRLYRPLAPYLSAELSGTRISVSDLVASIEDEPDSVRWIAEGAGGVLVPLNESEFMTDLMIRLEMPVLVVARSTLGTINHTLMTLEVLRSLTIPVAGVILTGDSNPENREAIERWGAVEIVGEIPRFPKLTAEILAEWAVGHLDPQDRLASYLL